MTPAGVVSVFRADSGRTNGNTFDARGRLVSCEGAEQGPGGRRRVVRTDIDAGKVRGPHRPLRGQAVQRPQRRLRRHQGPHLVHRPVLRRGPLVAGDGRRGGLPDRPRRQGHAGRLPARRRAPQRPGRHARRQDPLPDRQPLPARRQPQGLGVRPSTTTAPPARQRLVFDFGKGRGGDGMRLDTARQPLGRRRDRRPPHRRARPPTSPPAST